MEENKNLTELPETIEVKTGKVSILLYGLIGGLIGILVTVIMYTGGVDLWFNWMLNNSWFVISLGLGIYAALQIRKLNDGHLSYQTGLKYIFGVMIVTLFIVFVTHYILMNFIDPSFADAVTVRSAEMYADAYRKFGMKEADIERLMDDITSYNNYSLGKIAIAFGVTAIWCFIIAAIATLFVKKNKYKHLGL